MNQLISHQNPLLGVVIAGGRSRRMGKSKSETLLLGETLLEHTIRRLAPQVTCVAINSDEPDVHASYDMISDHIPGKPGPLAGIHAAMRFSGTCYPEASHVMTVPVDSPLFPKDAVAQMAALAGADTIVVGASCDTSHPVFGLWPVSLAFELKAWLKHDGNRRVRDFLAGRNVREVNFPFYITSSGCFDPFFNINTPQDLEIAERFLQEQSSS